MNAQGDKGFLRGLLDCLPYFLNWYGEWHSLLEGFADGFCPLRSRYVPNEELWADIECEHHYYGMGRVLGFTCLILLITSMIRWIV